MGFADAYSAYLQKHAIRGPLISVAPDPQLNTIIAIPASNESGLTTCLDSLFNCDPPVAPAEVIVLINSSETSSREIIAANRRSYEEVREWIQQHRMEGHRMELGEPTSLQQENNQGSGQQDNATCDQDTSQPQEKLRFHVVLVEDLPDKHFGAGLARKLVMDEAVRRLTGRAGGTSPELPEEDQARKARGKAVGQLTEDEARRATKGKVNGIIVSLDADTVVRADYLRAVEDHFRQHPGARGCSISFEHPLSRQEYALLFSKPASQPPSTPDRPSPSHSPSENVFPDDLPKENLPPESQTSSAPDNRIPENLPTENFPPEVFEAVTNYELHQRYYLQAVRYTGYPYAFHTVGSCFAVQVEAYCQAGGMSRRQAGEDFYFIQKVAMQGGFTECRTTRVYPSPRPSDRVPFGTGPDIARQISTSLPPYLTYHPELFELLQTFYKLIPQFYWSDDPAATDGGPASNPAAVLKGVPRLLRGYLEETGFGEELEEIRRNTASEAAFRKRFLGKFNMFWILKYLHYAEDQGVKKMEVTAAAKTMLAKWHREPVGETADNMTEKVDDEAAENGTGEADGRLGTTGHLSSIPVREMLLIYRKLFG